MTELYPSEIELAALSATTDPEQEVLFVPTGESPYYLSFYKMLYRLLDVARRAGDLRVHKDGDMTFGVRPGKFMDGSVTRDYDGASEQALTNNQTNYVYLTADATLTVNTTGFPDAGTTPHIPLATIVTSAGQYAHTDITDYRGRALTQCASSLTPALAVEAATFFAATDISGAQAETLSDGSNADALHVHGGAGIETESITNEDLANGAVKRVKLYREDKTYSIPIASGSILKTAAVNVAFNTAADETNLGMATGTPGTNHPILQSSQIDGGGAVVSAVETARIIFPLPIEYDAGQAITLRLRAKVTAACNVHSKVDAVAYVHDREGGLGADICATAEQAITTSWADKDFTITPTGLVAGDMLDITLQTDLDDTGGTAGAYGQIGSVQMILKIKG